ncbi:DENN domain-containing protein 5A-like [Acanthaster planci]|uniref:DENN domain-containing protein 5A-like n=1 Tax=Acanthaster planci TaxID=133434 RepID=A0A8B8A1U4_ACAPL|nr:DENN domain-containing protein 5A-like [Acanthaster planci]
MGSTGQQTNRFVDYFVVCGLEPSAVLQPGQFSGENTHHVHPLLRGYKSAVLSHYPAAVEGNPFDSDGINMLCMPKGLTVRTQKQDREPKFHSFLMTREDGSRTYGAALTFYEQATSPRICAAMEVLQIKYQEDSLRRKMSNIESPSRSQVILESLSPKMDRRGFSPKHRRSSSPGISTMQSPKMRRKTTPVHVPGQQRKVANFDPLNDTLYVSKCVCLIMQVPFIQPCRRFLEAIHSAIKAMAAPPLPLESYIYNILYEVPGLPPGRTLSFSSAPGETVVCQRPASTELPLCDYSMRECVELLGVEHLMELMTCALLENQILLVSREYHRLMLVAECISALLFPFQWQHVYVPILPANLMHFLDAPVPFIMGLHLDDGMDQTNQLEIPSHAALCFVDIDNNCIDLPEDLPLFPNRHRVVHDLINLLQRYNVSPRPLSEKTPTRTPTRGEGSFDWSELKTELTLIGTGSSRNLAVEGSIEADQDSSYFSSPSRGESPTSVAPTKTDILRNNEIVSKVAAIVQRTGVITSISELEDRNSNTTSPDGDTNPETWSPVLRKDVEELSLNSAIRELFLSKLVELLRHYETFVIQPTSHSIESWFANREHMQNFDKASFLSDQPEAYLPFLFPFVETQMFATFIDNKIISNWEEKEERLKIFDGRIEHFPASNPQTPTTEVDQLLLISEAEANIRQRAVNIDYTAPSPHELTSKPVDNNHKPGFFPRLQEEVLLKEPFTPKNKHRNNAPWRRKERQQQHSEHLQLAPQEREQIIQQARKGTMPQPVLSHLDQKQTNWKFVEGLLKECKVKTKKMLVSKMGQEAVELGHGDVNRSGVEENTLIASLCDLLERIFSHGIQKKQGKSALWSHVMGYRKMKEKRETHPEQSLSVPTQGSEARRRSSSAADPVLSPLPTDLLFDVRNVENMSQIKTDVGNARAFVRLALERKLLHKHLKLLLTDYELCKKRYKRYAFLRTEEEKEQFLYHLLSLNAVDYFCFTNSFISTVVSYRVLVVTSRKFQAATSANCWICVSGEINDSKMIPIPKSSQDFVFQHSNLGILTTVRIGHDNTGLLPRWMVDYVLVRNEITGHTYKFPCGRWIGRGVDDDSLERLLVGDLLPSPAESEEQARGSRTPPRSSSPIMLRHAKGQAPKLDRDSIQEMLTDAVNNIVKHFYKPEKERGRLTVLLCGERGLVQCMEIVLQYGFRSARLFRNNFFIWDFLEKVAKYLDSIDQDDEGRLGSVQEKRARRTFCFTVHQINQGAAQAGKDGKFQLFVCIGIRDHMLHWWLPVLSETPVASSMYEDYSFLNCTSALDFLVNLLMQLDEFNISLESSITKGVEL